MAIQRITVEELKRRMDAHESLTILDTRSPEAWKKSDVQIPASLRVPPDEVAKHLAEIARDRLAVAYCT
jgi:rhodanese-related sulfurtransferase